MKVGPHVMTHSHAGHHHDREVVPRVGSAQAGGNLKLIQCQLMLLLHARRCQQRHELMLARNGQQAAEANGENAGTPNGATTHVAKALMLNCPVRHCQAMKAVLTHMKTCRLGGTCTYQHCTSSLRILSHWTNCEVAECPLCALVRVRMTRAKEWEATLPRSSRYTLLAAALRSSQTPRPIPPNCQVAEQAQEGQSGVPCQEELDDLRQQRQWPMARMNGNRDDGDQKVPQLQRNGVVGENRQRKAGEKCVKCKSISAPQAKTRPSLDQVRKAYEQLGIPCPEQALLRLMATLPNAFPAPRASPPQPPSPQVMANDEPEDLSMDDNSMDVGVEHDSDSRSSIGDQGIYDCCSCASFPPGSRDPPPQQQPVISSTTSTSVPQRLPLKSSR